MELLRPIGTRFHHTYYTSSSTNGHSTVDKIIYEYEVIGHTLKKEEICRVIGYVCKMSGLEISVKENGFEG